MKHEITLSYRTMHNIFCAAVAYYKEYRDKSPEIFDQQDEIELACALKLQKFTLETSANAYKIKDAK